MIEQVFVINQLGPGGPAVNVNITGPLGQTVMAASIPVVIASDQSDITVIGDKTNNNAAPGANNVGVLPAIANAVAPIYTEGNQVLLSTDLSGSQRVTTSGSPGTLTDRSGTITLGGTSQTLMAANASRKYLLVQNVSTGDLWFNFGVAAVINQPSIRLSTGDSFVMESNFISTQAINIIGATTGQAFSSKEG